jgi:hypothetical protein
MKPLTISWTIPAEVVEALEKFIAAQSVSETSAEGVVTTTPKYSSVADLVEKHLHASLVAVILDRFPPKAVEDLQVVADVALAAVVAEKAKVITAVTASAAEASADPLVEKP